LGLQAEGRIAGRGARSVGVGQQRELGRVETLHCGEIQAHRRQGRVGLEQHRLARAAAHGDLGPGRDVRGQRSGAEREGQVCMRRRGLEQVEADQLQELLVVLQRDLVQPPDHHLLHVRDQLQ
jgi:hypothetical protein